MPEPPGVELAAWGLGRWLGNSNAIGICGPFPPATALDYEPETLICEQRPEDLGRARECPEKLMLLNR